MSASHTKRFPLLCGAAVLTFAAGPIAAQTSRDPEIAACNRRVEFEQSANPATVVPLELSSGLTVFRSATVPFTASARLLALFSPLSDTRRFKAGPLVALALRNPQVEGQFGGRLGYRVWAPSLRPGGRLDLGLGADLFVEGSWETSKAFLAGAGGNLDLSLFQVQLRGTVDTRRGELRAESGIGIPLYRRLPRIGATVPAAPTPWDAARTEFDIELRVGVTASVAEAGALCDWEAIRVLANAIRGLERQLRGAPDALSRLPERLRDLGLVQLASSLADPDARWRSTAREAMAAVPGSTEGSAVRELMAGARDVLWRDFGVRVR